MQYTYYIYAYTYIHTHNKTKVQWSTSGGSGKNGTEILSIWMQIREEMDPPGAAAVVPVNGLSFIHRTVTMTSYFNQVPPPLLRSLSARSVYERVMPVRMMRPYSSSERVKPKSNHFRQNVISKKNSAMQRIVSKYSKPTRH